MASHFSSINFIAWMWPESEWAVATFVREGVQVVNFHRMEGKGAFQFKGEGSERPTPLAELGQQGRAAGKHLGNLFPVPLEKEGRQE